MKLHGAAETSVRFRLSQPSGDAGKKLWSLSFFSEASAEVDLVVPSIARVVPDLRAVLSALLTSGAICVMDGYSVSVHNMYGMAAREGFMHARN